MTPEESLERFGRTNDADITLEQRKNRRKAFAERVGAILIPRDSSGRETASSEFMAIG